MTTTNHVSELIDASANALDFLNRLVDAGLINPQKGGNAEKLIGNLQLAILRAKGAVL